MRIVYSQVKPKVNRRETGNTGMSQAPTSKIPFPQSAGQAEKARVLKDTTNTRVAYTNVVDPPAGGRFAKPSQSPDPSQLYPRLPPSSPWHSDPVPNELPLGFSVEDVPVCGELHEQLPPVTADASSPLVAVNSPLSAPDVVARVESGTLQRRKFT
jgi:hypothetical protein